MYNDSKHRDAHTFELLGREKTRLLILSASSTGLYWYYTHKLTFCALLMLISASSQAL